MNQNNPNEDRSTRFKRVAQRRTDTVLQNIRILGNCSNKSTYQYSDEEVSKIFRAIEEQLKITKARFKRARPNKFIL
jgi:hypothetical protein